MIETLCAMPRTFRARGDVSMSALIRESGYLDVGGEYSSQTSNPTFGDSLNWLMSGGNTRKTSDVHQLGISCPPVPERPGQSGVSDTIPGMEAKTKSTNILTVIRLAQGLSRMRPRH